MLMSINRPRLTLACVALGLVMRLPSIALAQMAGMPFTCDASLYIVIGNNSILESQLYLLNRSTQPFTFDPVGPPTTDSVYASSFTYNALAYNPLDNYMYAVVVHPNNAGNVPYTRGDIIRIGSDGIAESLGKVAGLDNYQAIAAAFLADGTYVLGRSGELVSIDVTTTPPTLVGGQGIQTVSGTSYFDFAVDPTDLTPNRIYFVNESGTDRISFADALTATVEGNLPNATGTNINAGSQFFDSFGTLYYRSNSNNIVYKVDMDATSPTYGQATSVAAAPSGGSHDGASCAFNIAMEKIVSPTSVEAGNTVTYTYRLSNPRSLPVSGLTFTDSMSDSRTFVGGSLVNPLGGTVNAYGGTGTLQISNLFLPSNSVTTITVDVEIPNVAAAGEVLNQASLSGLDASLGGTIVSDFPDSPVFGDPTPLTITAAPTVQVSGTVFADVDHDGIRDAGESGIAGVTVVLHNTTYGICDSVQSNGSGVYQFTSVVNGNYQIIEAAGEAVPNPGSCPSTEADPANYISTTPNTRPVVVSGTALSNQDFGDFNGSQLTGTVFTDDGTGSGTPNNGRQDGGETGLGGVTVTATDGGTTTYATTTTAADGTYTLLVPATATTVAITETNPSRRISTGGAAGDTGGTYERATDTVSFTATAGSFYSGVNFGDVPVNTFAPDGQQSALPGTTIFYPHTFTAGSAGAVSFGSSSTPTPPITGWSHVFYHDSNCSGGLDSGEPQLSAPSLMVAGETLCLLVKVFVPVAAAMGAQDQLTVSATFIYDNATPVLNASLSRTDLTTVGQSAAGTFTKSVDKATVLPGEVLTYTLTYRNMTSEAMHNLRINDVTPVYTTFVGATCGVPLPPSVTGCTVATAPAVGATGAVEWTFTGSLAPGASGTVQYQVQIDQ